LLRFVLQRVSCAEVVINELSCGKMLQGIVIFLGVGRGFNENERSALQPVLEKCADKVLGLRIFSDSQGKMNLSVKDVAGGLYIVSQFTLFADCKKGSRPGFSAAASPDFARGIYEDFLKILKMRSPADLQIYSGEFAADMKVSLLNDGPVTLILEVDLGGIR
jgi:D-tyrosyl-tRNA(Tyr) deacylase